VSGCVLRLDCDSRQGARAQQPSRVKLIFVLQQQPVHRLRLLVLVWLGLGWVGLVFVGRLGGMDVKGISHVRAPFATRPLLVSGWAPEKPMWASSAPRCAENLRGGSCAPEMGPTEQFRHCAMGGRGRTSKTEAKRSKSPFRQS
jgi:hypothetical protein